MSGAPELRLLDPTGSGWANLGLWNSSRTYPEAARALAVWVGEAARLGVGARVADLGCGPGPSLELWRARFGAGAVVGFEPGPAGRLAEARATGDAQVSVCRAPAEDVSSVRELDAVLSVDAAYHFDHRRWFVAVAAALREGGRLAWTDLVRTGRLGPGLRAARRLFGLGRDAPMEEGALRARLAEAGFELTAIDDLSEPVFGGFARHIRGLREAGQLRGPGSGKLRITAAGCRAVLAAGAVRYVGLSARRIR